MQSFFFPRLTLANCVFLLLILVSPLTYAVDTDGDGLDDSVETNTGIYVSTSDTGTDPSNADTDSDTIPDGLDLPPGRDPLVANWAVSAGADHNCALGDSGVMCWGRDDFGQATVPELSNPVLVSAGRDHSCALDDNGVVCWGLDDDGQATVPALSNPVSVSAGSDHSCALDDSGVTCWGNNDSGQITVPALTNPMAVSAGGFHSCALDDGAVVCWGAGVTNTGIFPEVGQSIVPVLVNPVSVSAGLYHNCALDNSGVVCWGFNGFNQVTVPALTNSVGVSSGGGHTCALDDNGVVCWGLSLNLQTTVPALINPVSVSAGGFHSCALDDNGVTCWGRNDDGQATVPVLSFDKDLDGVLDAAEDVNSNGTIDVGETDPLNPDSDFDGFSDGEEIIAGTDPLDDASYPVIANGDVNDDGQVDLRDLLLAMQILSQQYIPSQIEQDRWDMAPLVNGVPASDGQNNLGDYLVLQRTVLGIIGF